MCEIFQYFCFCRYFALTVKTFENLKIFEWFFSRHNFERFWTHLYDLVNILWACHHLEISLWNMTACDTIKVIDFESQSTHEGTNHTSNMNLLLLLVSVSSSFLIGKVIFVAFKREKHKPKIRVRRRTTKRWSVCSWADESCRFLHSAQWFWLSNMLHHSFQ